MGQESEIWGKEQIAPSGVPWPNRSAGSRISWGIIDNTNIGMVTVTSWSFDAQFDIRAKFEQAVDEMMHVHQADGIIFDFRFNTGGGALAREGLQLLFNTDVPTVGFDRRVPGSTDVLAMEPDPQRFEANLVIRGDPATYYNKPIAILIGPGSISAGELEARRMSFRPRARVFGLPAPGGNTGSDFVSIGDADWFVSRSHSTHLGNGRRFAGRPLSKLAASGEHRRTSVRGAKRPNRVPPNEKSPALLRGFSLKLSRCSLSTSRNRCEAWLPWMNSLRMPQQFVHRSR